MSLFRRKPVEKAEPVDNRSEWIEIQVPVKKKGQEDGKCRTRRAYQCRVCGYKNVIKTRYCPDCGRRCKD